MLESDKTHKQAKAPTNGKTSETQVLPKKAKRRRFTAAYKLGIIEQIEDCSKPGEVGALLRREGLYSSQIARWRKLQREGKLAGSADRKRGPTPVPSKARQELEQLRKENQRLAHRLAQAETIIEVQKKLSTLLEQTTKSSEQN